MIKNLKKLRLETNSTQQQLADYIMVSQQSVNKYENHDVEPDIETLIKIADYFDVSVDYLIGRKDWVDSSELFACENNDKTIIDLCKKLNKKQKEAVINLIKSFK